MKRRSFIRIACSASLSSAAWAETPSARGASISGSSAIRTIKAKLRFDDLHWRNYGFKAFVDFHQLKEISEQEPDGVSEFGGSNLEKLEAQGFFRLAKTERGWWFVDPSGCRFLSIGLNAVAPAGSRAAQEMFEKTYEGDAKKWSATQIPLLKSWGFNTAACWSNKEAIFSANNPLPYTPSGFPSLGKPVGPLEAFSDRNKIGVAGYGNRSYSGGIWPIFSGKFEQFVNEEAKSLAQTSQDPWILGRFLDNELTLPLLENYLNYSGSDEEMQAARTAAQLWIKQRKGATISISEDDRREWSGFVYDRYLSIVVPAIRKNDPNHLVFGPRVNGISLKVASVFESIGKWCDVVCVNPYGHWTVPTQAVEQWAKAANRPLIVSEFYAKGQDSKLGNDTGVGFLLESQKDRGIFYQNFILSGLHSGSLIGWHWHRYRDHNVGRYQSNKGVISIGFKPYDEMVGKMAEVNRRVYSIAKVIRA